MEFEGFKRCLDFILNEEMQVSTMISDRHVSIAKYMREEKKDITHYFDLWHLKKSKPSLLKLTDLVVILAIGDCKRCCHSNNSGHHTRMSIFNFAFA